MSVESKVTMTRVIVGVASVGATLGFLYLYNKYQGRKGRDSSSSKNSTSTATGIKSRFRQPFTESGKVKKVTFKTFDSEDEIELEKSTPTEITAVTCKSKSSQLSSKLEVEGFGVDSDSHASLGKVVDEGRSSDIEKSSSSETQDKDFDHSGLDSTNKYENNSTLKLEDSSVVSAINNHTIINANINDIASDPKVVASPSAPVEEVSMSKSVRGPLMTSTPLPSKDSATTHVPLRAAAAMFKPHSSDLPSSKPGSNSIELTAENVDYDSHQCRKELKIPRDIVASLIGKKGCNIKGIQAQSNTTIVFHDETLPNRDRVCLIRGAPENVVLAESMVEKFISDQPTIYSETLTVPLSSVGRIIGKGGDTIRSIQDLSKARVTVESNNHYGSDSGPTRTITIKGSENQIRMAKQLICEKVEEERNLRKSINDATAGRTHRRGGGTTSPSSPTGGSLGSSASSNNEPSLSLKQDGILEVFVSCVYHPNDFWIQVVGRDAIELDKLCENMTDHYNGYQNDAIDSNFNVGDIVAAPFEVDGKIYRAKIMRMDENGVEVSYLDYGDRRVLPVSEIYELHPNFLQLRYQAIHATLNLGRIGEKWEDDVINVFCDLTYCAQWQSLTAKIKNYLKDAEDGHDVICIELLDKDVNIGEELIRRGLATPRGPSGCNGNGAQGLQRKSYAAVALGVSNNSVPPSTPLISSTDPTVQESMEGDRNGN